jgi:hypothetical protein
VRRRRVGNAAGYGFHGATLGVREGEGVSDSDRARLQGKGKATTDAKEAAQAFLADIVPCSGYEAHPEGSVNARPVDAPTLGATFAYTHELHLQESLAC